MRLVDIDKLLPEDVPAGEAVLWHGRPDWRSLARRAFHVDVAAAYFAAISMWAFIDVADEAGFVAGLASAGRAAALGVLACLILGFLAWLSARTTLYVITSRRVVMKIGIALPIFFNLPHSTIVSAALRTYRGGTGDIPLTLTPGRRIAYLHLWPHARPFCFSAPQPSLREVPDAHDVADILAGALSKAGATGAHARAEVGKTTAKPGLAGAVAA